jgi:hypothetical protein
VPLQRGFADIGVDTPAKMRNLILGKSFALMGIEALAAGAVHAHVLNLVDPYRLQALWFQPLSLSIQRPDW